MNVVTCPNMPLNKLYLEDFYRYIKIQPSDILWASGPLTSCFPLYLCGATIWFIVIKYYIGNILGEILNMTIMIDGHCR